MLLITKDGEIINITKKNKKIINLAKRVEKQSNVYKNQLKECSSSLSRNKYIIF
jgi:hypothetical protein